jgi:hypothetical protein
MTDNTNYHERSPHFDGEQETVINAPVGPQMGIKTVSPEKKRNANPFHLDVKHLDKKGIEGFSSFFEK